MAILDFSRLYADLENYAERLQGEAVAAADSAARYLRERTVARAQEMEGWDRLADNIEVWSEDGRLTVGLTDNMLTSQAFALEFGDEHRPPQPLFRTMGADINNAQRIASEHMTSSFGHGRFV